MISFDIVLEHQVQILDTISVAKGERRGLTRDDPLGRRTENGEKVRSPILMIISNNNIGWI